MLGRLLSTRSVVSLIVIFSFITMFAIVKVFESSSYLKCPLCLHLNATSAKKSFYQPVNNTEDEQVSVDDNSIWCLHMANRLDNEHPPAQPPVLRAPSINSTRLHRLPYYYSQWKNSTLIPRRINQCEHSLCMRLLMIIERICRKHKIPFMLSDGTLLGSLRHHDITPWDTDMDIMIPFEDKNRFLNIAKQMNGTLAKHYDKSKYYKLSFQNTPSAGGYSWNFPFIDIYMYIKNATHMWRYGYPDAVFENKYIFPLVMRPLGELWLPTPREPRRFFDFDPFDECKSYDYDHRLETTTKSILLKCNELKDIYPFVEQNNQSKSIEVLKINNTIIHTIIYN
jgi:hypothetical protein